MKAKIIILVLSGLLAGGSAVSAQDNSPVANPAQQDSVVSTNAPVETGTVATATAVPGEAATNAPAQAETVVASGQGSVVSAAPTPSQSGSAAIIPLIVMDDVPLTDAIKNLARQASLNYMLDPKIAFGQVGPDGRSVPQPTVSIRWENVSAEQALYALLNNYSLQLIDDPKTKIVRITIQDPAAPPALFTKIVQLKFASPSNVLAAVQTTLTDRRSKVMGDIRTSQLVLLATERELNAVDSLVERLDTPTKQVLIEAKLLETSMNPSSIKGVDWSGTLQKQNVRFGNNQQLNVPADSMNNTLSQSYPKLLFDTAKGFNPATAFLDADGVSAVFSFINNNSEAKVISSPRTVTLDNETATLSVTRMVPIFTTTPGSANTPGGSSVTYSNLGVILIVTPRISADDRVNLKVIPEVSRIFSQEVLFSAGQENTAYTFDSRKMETSVMIPSGHTLVLGGLVQDDIKNGDTKVPLLGDIPVLGAAFRYNSKSRQKNNLLIFITPTIIQDSDFQATKSDFLKTPLAADSEPDWSSWNSGTPHDWSKPEQPINWK